MTGSKSRACSRSSAAGSMHKRGRTKPVHPVSDNAPPAYRTCRTSVFAGSCLVGLAALVFADHRLSVIFSRRIERETRSFTFTCSILKAGWSALLRIPLTLTDRQWHKHLARAVPGIARQGHGNRLLRHIAAQPRARRLYVRRLRAAIVLIRRQVRLRHRLAQLFSADSRGERRRV